jgi:molecular chaperone IbpA
MTNFTIRTLDLPALSAQLHRHSIGFDQMFDQLNRSFSAGAKDNYPPHNVVQIDETHFLVEVAVSGFAENEIDVELADNVLTVKGEKAKDENEANVQYLHKGISTRNFTRNFPLAENVLVRGASVQNGILAVALDLVVPDEKKAKKIEITFAK